MSADSIRESKWLSNILEASGSPAALVALDGTILNANRGYRDRSCLEGEIAGRYCYQVFHGRTTPCWRDDHWCPLRESSDSLTPHRCVHLHCTCGGKEHHEVTATPILDERGHLSAILMIIHVVAVSRVLTPSIVGRSPAITEILRLIERVAPTDLSVLVQGETGTGKELAAKAVHEMSSRRDGAFVPLDCSGLTDSLFESELFGHEKGSFTGAHARKIGLVETAAGGTLFLDEVGDIPLHLQVKLLRLLETGTFRRVGGVETRRTEFRLVCATHRDLKAMVREGEFRADLYFRISAFPIVIPPLRERPEDVEVTAGSLLRSMICPAGSPVLSRETVQALQRLPLRGNVRELRNILQRACLLTVDGVIRPEHLPDGRPEEGSPKVYPRTESGSLVTLREMEQRYLRWVVEQSNGDRAGLARRLGVSQRTLYRKLQELGRGDRGRS